MVLTLPTRRTVNISEVITFIDCRAPTVTSILIILIWEKMMFLALYGGLCLMFCFVWKRVIFYGMVWMQLSCFIEVFYNQCQIWNIAACRISLGNTKAVKMEEWCYVSGRRKILFTVLSFPRWTSNVTLFNKFDQNQSFVSLPQFDDSEQARVQYVLFICL